jgi:hypothetical protein
MDVSLARTVRQILFIFDIPDFVLIGQCPVSMNIFVPNLEALHMGSKPQSGDFLRNYTNNFD